MYSICFTIAGFVFSILLLVIYHLKSNPKLIENKIYIPQWWKYILSMGVSNNFERKLSKYLLPLPIDQRYNDIDMEFIANIIIKYLNNNIK